MFDALTEKLQSPLGDLRGRGILDEEAVARAMREVRLALLEADVNFGVHEELTELLGSSDSRLAFSPRPPTTILLAGLQGSGKTTAAAKLARLLREEGK